jgi:hypothetical protein
VKRPLIAFAFGLGVIVGGAATLGLIVYSAAYTVMHRQGLLDDEPIPDDVWERFLNESVGWDDDLAS